MDYQKEPRQVNPYGSPGSLAQTQQKSGIGVMPPYAAITQPNPAVQKQSLQTAEPPIPSGGKRINALGVVAPEANLRSAPSTGDRPLKLLAFNTKVQVLKDLGGGWYYISTAQGEQGYVASQFIKQGLPEPGAMLHRVESGETAIGIAERYFKRDAVGWGQDLRFYVNALVAVNHGAGNPHQGIYTVNAQDSWADAKVRSGYYIWIPSPAFAKALKGLVASGSLSYGVKEGITQTLQGFAQKLDDFNYANQFVARILPQKLNDAILESIKSALLNFAIGMAAAGLLLAISAGLGAAIGALAGFLAGGVGAAPGAALGAKVGLEIGVFLLKWIGLGMLVAQGAQLLGRMGIAFGNYVIQVWEAKGDHKKLEQCANLCAEALKAFLLGVLELGVVLVAALGVGRAMATLANCKLGKAIGTENLQAWMNQRAKYPTLGPQLEGSKLNYSYNLVENPGPLAALNPNAAATFAGGKYNVIKLSTDLVLYRGGKAGGGKNAFGQYFTRTAPKSRIAVRIDSAVKAQWIDPQTGALTGTSPIEAVYALKIPKGTVIYEGPAGYQSGVYVGGKEQIFIAKPWEIPGVTVISETPLP